MYTIGEITFQDLGVWNVEILAPDLGLVCSVLAFDEQGTEAQILLSHLNRGHGGQ